MLLKKHKLYKHSEDRKLVECEIMSCHKTFTSMANYIVHKRIHTGEHPFECEFCEKGFRTKANRNDHQRRHINDK